MIARTPKAAADRSLPRGAAALGLLLAVLATTAPARAQLLYRLQTRCSLRGAAALSCTVEAREEGEATVYRHRIGAGTTTIRISDRPIRMALWDGDSQQWRHIRRASARFSANTVCFNGDDLCVINPNYLNSVRESNPDATLRRDLVRVLFGADGRVQASCYDDGCEEKRP